MQFKLCKRSPPSQQRKTFTGILKEAGSEADLHVVAVKLTQTPMRSREEIAAAAFRMTVHNAGIERRVVERRVIDERLVQGQVLGLYPSIVLDAGLRPERNLSWIEKLSPDTLEYASRMKSLQTADEVEEVHLIQRGLTLQGTLVGHFENYDGRAKNRRMKTEVKEIDNKTRSLILPFHDGNGLLGITVRWYDAKQRNNLLPFLSSNRVEVLTSLGLQ